MFPLVTRRKQALEYYRATPSLVRFPDCYQIAYYVHADPVSIGNAIIRHRNADLPGRPHIVCGGVSELIAQLGEMDNVPEAGYVSIHDPEARLLHLFPIETIEKKYEAVLRQKTGRSNTASMPDVSA